MKELDIHSVTVNKWKAASASKTKVEQRPNLLKQDFSTTGLNQKMDRWYDLYSNEA